MEKTMTGQFTFKTVRSRRPYFAAPVRRRFTHCRLDFVNAMGPMAASDAQEAQRVAA